MPTLDVVGPVPPRRDWWPVLIAAAVLAAFANCFQGVFLFDDLPRLVRDARMARFPDCVLHSSRPLTNLTFYLNFALGGARPGLFHAVNLLIHIGAALALYGLARRTLATSPALARNAPASHGLAAAIALLWALHPLQTASVTYIVQRAEALAGAACFLTLYALARAIGSRRPAGWAFGAVAACALGMAAKPTMLVAPLLALLYDRAFFAGSCRTALRLRPWMYAGLFAALLPAVALLLLVPNDSSTSTGAAAGVLAPGPYLFTQCGVVLHYLRLVFWPQGLCLDYAWPRAVPSVRAFGEAAAWAGLLAGSVWGTLRRHPAGFAGIAFFLLLAPSSSVFPVADLAFEHRMYAPLACVLALVVLTAHRVLRGRARPGLQAGVACGTAVALAAATHARNACYTSELVMWENVVAHSPANLRARSTYGAALAEAGQAAAAQREFEAVLAGIPADQRLQLDNGTMAVGTLVQADATPSHYFTAHVNLGVLAMRAFGRPDLAATHFRHALAVFPWRDDVGRMLTLAEQRLRPSSTNAAAERSGIHP